MNIELVKHLKTKSRFIGTEIDLLLSDIIPLHCKTGDGVGKGNGLFWGRDVDVLLIKLFFKDRSVWSYIICVVKFTRKNENILLSLTISVTRV